MTYHAMSCRADASPWLLLFTFALLLSGCVTTPVGSYQPPANPAADDPWHYRLAITPPLPADQIQVDVLYEAQNPHCPVPEVGLRLTPEQQSEALTFDVLMDQFRDPQCDWHANQIWIALGQAGGYTARFSLPIGSAPQVRWCRLNPQHGACFAREADARAFKVPGTVHRVRVLHDK